MAKYIKETLQNPKILKISNVKGTFHKRPMDGHRMIPPVGSTSS